MLNQLGVKKWDAGLDFIMDFILKNSVAYISLKKYYIVQNYKQ
jgi:hypothetical protein